LSSDYPDFFPKLYALLTGDILHARYCTRFLKLLDLFLTSSHLPSYMVTAFLKKLARLALHAPSPVAIAVLVIMWNLLRNHPTCRHLLHALPNSSENQSDTKIADAVDPFDMTELDMSKCGAQQSSLWELEVMQHHHNYLVANFVTRFSRPINEKSSSMNVEEYLDKTVSDMVHAELESHHAKHSIAALGDPNASFTLL
jgi:U3 small nucleolar RNA-associated protein 19